MTLYIHTDIIPFMVTIGEKIKHWRQKKGLTQNQLAEKAGLTIATIGRIETGIRQGTNITTLQRMADALGISLDKLLNPPKERR